MLACAVEPGAPHCAAVGRQGGSLDVFDLSTSRRVTQVICLGHLNRADFQVMVSSHV